MFSRVVCALLSFRVHNFPGKVRALLDRSWTLRQPSDNHWTTLSHGLRSRATVGRRSYWSIHVTMCAYESIHILNISSWINFFPPTTLCGKLNIPNDLILLSSNLAPALAPHHSSHLLRGYISPLCLLLKTSSSWSNLCEVIGLFRYMPSYILSALSYFTWWSSV